MKKDKKVGIVEVEMHIMDKHSVIIEQADTLALPTNPHYVTLFIREHSQNRVLAFTFEDWQKLHTKLYTPVPANMLVMKGPK